MSVRRDTREKLAIALANLSPDIHAALEAVQANLYERALKFREDNTHSSGTMAELAAGLQESPGFHWVNWCGSDECEDALMEHQASIRAIPLEDADKKPTGPCVNCGKDGTSRVLVAKSY
jgi:prolyl-tRNA synthetase